MISSSAELEDLIDGTVSIPTIPTLLAKVPLATAEGEVFGFTHAHVGGLLAQRWKLAGSVQAAVMYHHSPGTSPDDWARGFLVQAANTIAHRVAGPDSCSYRGDTCDDDALAALGLDEEELQAISEEVRDASGNPGV